MAQQERWKVTHINGRLLDHKVILLNYVHFQEELLLKESICFQEEWFFSFKNSSL